MSLTLPAQLSLPATSLGTLSAYPTAPKPLVLYFTQDNTPGCTTERAWIFRDAYADFVAAGCQINGACRATRSSRTKTSRPNYPLPF